ncbi:CBS domain-containing protein [Oceanobacillus bengalensis]|uniref:CBS domain-containing protein n=1 Tax=Oceanobacillus bengalensis TaxID=1435466 RepID=A0A494Z7X5_9BACI|nr:CBS domain-containing protein [Oceanobacillus bengalensis]RKQ18712.1 CBS domain-containing protein [Oceanobacillus bengalensis]
MYKNSEIFLTTFNRIEKEIKSSLMNKKDVGFSKAVKILRNSNPIVKKYSDDLLEFAELRNAIVHNKIDMNHAIAEPHDAIVEKIEKIEMEITQPRSVASLFSRKVISFQGNEPLTNALAIIEQKGFTKFPIYEGEKFKGIITEKGITVWLSNNMESSIRDALIKDVLVYEEDDNYRHIAGETSVYKAEQIFKEQIGKGNRLQALLITADDNQTDKLIGIITNWDIMNI